MAFNVSIMPIKAIFTDWDAAFDAPFPYGASTVARAIRYAADNGAKVINLSIGSFFANTAPRGRDGVRHRQGRVHRRSPPATRATRGNPPIYPAVYAKDMDGAMAVAAVDFNLARAYYSNVNDYVEIAAPGGDNDEDLNDDGFADGILQQTLDPTRSSAGVFNQFVYFFAQGTSMATAHVSGLAALLMDQGITTPQAVEAGHQGVRDRRRRPAGATTRPATGSSTRARRFAAWGCADRRDRAVSGGGLVTRVHGRMAALVLCARGRGPPRRMRRRRAARAGRRRRARCGWSRTGPPSGAATRAWCWPS